MRAKDIILQLSAKLPVLVDDFTTSLSVISLVRNGTTVTGTTPVDHGLTSGASVNIVGAQTPINITSIVRVGIMATLVTTDDHDITKGAPKTLEIDGAVEPEFNGIFTILQVQSRRIVVFQVADTGSMSATGSPLLLNGSSVLQTYNGLRQVTSVPTATTFTYEINDNTLFTPAFGNISAKIQPRISGAVTDERAIESYTKQGNGQAWLFVVLNDGIANKDRALIIDGTANIQRTSHFKQYVTQTVSLFVFIPTPEQISGREARDRAEELLQPICQSILFAKFDSLVATGKDNALMFNEHGFHGYNTAFYIHRYTFELTLRFGIDDTVGADEDVALRAISMNQDHDVGTGKIISNI